MSEQGPRREEPECEAVAWWHGRRCGKHIPTVDVTVLPKEFKLVTAGAIVCPSCGADVDVPPNITVPLSASPGSASVAQCPGCLINHRLTMSAISLAPRGVRQAFGLDKTKG